MGNYFFDSSALVKKYALESGSKHVLRIFKPSADNTIFLARITPVETVAGLSRQNRIGSLSSENFDKALRRLRRAVVARFVYIEITHDIVEHAIELVRLHGLRGYDGVQLASALSVSSNLSHIAAHQLIFTSADKNLNKAAMSENLVVENPSDQ